MNKHYIVKLENGCWIADWEGDPGRTVVEENAKLFTSYSSAKKALEKARKYRMFENAEIISAG